MKVIELLVENFMGIKAVLIKPDTNVIRIEGKNGEGKSSLINSIYVACGGKEEIPENPIRNGETDARIRVDLKDIIVTRKFTENGTYLEVTSPDGRARYSRPQEMLDALFTKVSFDPQNFIDMKPAERRTHLLNLTGQKEKIETIEADRKRIYDSRTLVNRDVANLKGKLSDAPIDEDIEEIKVSDLMAELEAAGKEDAGKESLKIDCENYEDNISTSTETINETIAQIECLKESIKVLNADIDRLSKELVLTREEYDNLPASRVPDVKAQIANVETHNAHVRKIMDARELQNELKDREVEADTMTAEIKKLDDEKVKILADSNLPFENLTFEGDVMLIDNIPFDSRSTSEKIKASLAIGIAQNPKLRVLRIKNYAEFDEDSQALVEAFAEEHDIQIWAEVACINPSGKGIYIKDGEIAE